MHRIALLIGDAHLRQPELKETQSTSIPMSKRSMGLASNMAPSILSAGGAPPLSFSSTRLRLFMHLLPLLPLLLFSSCCMVVQAQEAPAFSTVKWETNVTHRTNVCERYAQWQSGQVSIADSLRGLNLSVVFTNYIDEPGSEGLFSLTDDGVVSEDNPPLHAQIMDKLALEAGFQWRNSFGVVDPLDGRDINNNRTYGEILNWSSAVYDISMDEWERSAKRVGRGTSFPEGFLDSSTIVVQLHKKKSLSWQQIWTFLLPFEPGVWWSILAVCVLTGVLYYILEKLDPGADDNNIEGDAGAAMYFSFITFTGHHEFNPRSFSARIVAFSLTFWALITAASYTANLASFLVSRSQSEVTYQTIQEAVDVQSPICLQRGSNIDTYISTNYPSANVVLKKSSRLVFEALNAGECKIAAVSKSNYETFRRNNEVNPNCALWWSGRVEQYVPSGLATKVDTGEYCTSLIDHVLDYHILNLKFEERYFGGVFEEYRKKTGDPRCVNEEMVDLLEEEKNSLYGLVEDTTSLSMYEMAGIFIVHAGFSLLALLLATFKFYRVRKAKVHSSLRNMIENSPLVRSKKNDTSGTAIGGETVIAADGEPTRSVYHCSGLEPFSEERESQRSYETDESNRNDGVERNKEEVSFFPLMRDLSSSERRLSV